MNSSPPSTTERAALSAPVQPAFNWIEIFAIPVATNIMETQPLVLLLFFIVFIFTGSGTPLPLGEVGITLLLLGLQWWVMFINYRVRQGIQQRTAVIMHVVGVVIALGLLLPTSLLALNITAMIALIGLVLFSWKRAIDKAKNGLNDEQLIFIFKLGVGILLIALILSILTVNGVMADLSTLLTYALPLFFLSGLLALSFTRVSIIRREQAQHGISQTDVHRGWLVALTFLWGVMVVGALALETFSFGTIQQLFLPVWSLLAFIVIWIIYAIFWVLLSIYQLLNALIPFKPMPTKSPQLPGQSTHSAVQSPSHVEQLPTWLLLAGRLILIALVLLVLFSVFRAILRRLHPHLEQNSEEEIREALSMRSILRERRQERTILVQTNVLLDTLDPDSIRARYRDLLQQMAERDERLSRRPEETPLEYQKRLITLLESSPNASRQSDSASDRELLIDLTQAYINERYGEQQSALYPHTDLPNWIPRLTDRLGR